MRLFPENIRIAPCSGAGSAVAVFSADGDLQRGSGSAIVGSGTAERIPRFEASGTIGNSSIAETSTEIRVLDDKPINLRVGVDNNGNLNTLIFPIGLLRFTIFQGFPDKMIWQGSDSGGAYMSIGGLSASIGSGVNSVMGWDASGISSFTAKVGVVITSDTTLSDPVDGVVHRISAPSANAVIVTLPDPSASIGRILIFTGESASTGGVNTEAIAPASGHTLRFVNSAGTTVVLTSSQQLQVKGRCIMVCAVTSTEWRVVGGIG